MIYLIKCIKGLSSFICEQYFFKDLEGWVKNYIHIRPTPYDLKITIISDENPKSPVPFCSYQSTQLKVSDMPTLLHAGHYNLVQKCMGKMNSHASITILVHPPGKCSLIYCLRV